MGKFPISNFQFPIKFKFSNFQIQIRILRTNWRLETGDWRLGYTLIELLVAITILGIIFSAGYISFRDFSRRQALAGAVRAVSGDLRLAQELAFSGKKPTGCITLNGYRFKTAADSYGIVAACSFPEIEYEVKVGVGLPVGVTMSAQPSPNIFFKILGQGNDISGGAPEVITLTQVNTSQTQTITITSGGEIK